MIKWKILYTFIRANQEHLRKIQLQVPGRNREKVFNIYPYLSWQYPIYIHELVVRAHQLDSVAQLVRALPRNCRATGSIPARDL